MRKIILCCIVISVLFCFFGCGNSNKKILNESTSSLYGENSDMSNPFETDENTKILGSISHSPTEIKTDMDLNALPFEYDGGEFALKYEVKAEGSAKNLGFLLFVDGVAQPYKTDINSNYEYLHYFELKKDNEPVDFTFKFIPITGKNGETVPLNIVSIYNAQFMPDMVESSSYGGYQSALSCMLKLHFNSDVATISSSEYPQKKIISTFNIRKENITKDFINNDLTNSNYLEEFTDEALNTKMFHLVKFNNKASLSNIALQKNKPLNIKYCLLGASGIKYKTTFYINHQPISYDDMISYESTIEKGMLHKIEFEIDTSKLDALNTFYAISVPTNYEDYPNVIALINKTPSILLYKEN